MLTVERLRELLRYDPETGYFFRLLTRPGSAPAGSIAGSINGLGYRKIAIDGKTYSAGRLVWFYVTGEWPEGHVDHRDRDKDNNRFVNLRDATRAQNRANSRRSAVSGLKGAYPGPRGRWRAAITTGGKTRHLGAFTTAEEAHQAYLAAARDAHGQFANPGDAR